MKLTSKFLTLMLLILGIQLTAQNNVTISNYQNTHNEFTSTAAYNTARFYLFNDGWYSKMQNPLHKYPHNTNPNANIYFIQAYDPTIPPALTRQTFGLPNGDVAPVAPSFINFHTDVAFDVSWNPVSLKNNFFVLLFKGKDTPSGSIEFYYNDNQIEVLELKDYANLPNLANLSFSGVTNTNASGYNKVAKWNYNNLSGSKSIRAIYVYAKVKVANPGIVTLGLKKDNQAIVSRNFQLETYPHDPNYIESSSCLKSDNTSQKAIYTVHFQNTGDGPANNVIVAEQLGATIPLFNNSTVELLASSHNCTLQLPSQGSGGVIFNFTNINLPGAGELPLTEVNKSKGWVQYSICTYNPTQYGCFNHYANIYFDSQPVVPTNIFTTCTTSNCTPVYCSGNGSNIRSKDVDKEVSVYPNPVTDWLTINMEEDSDYLVEIFNLEGKLVYSQKSGNFDINKQLDLRPLGTGMYFVEIISDKGNKTFKILKQ